VASDLITRPVISASQTIEIMTLGCHRVYLLRTAIRVDELTSADVYTTPTTLGLSHTGHL